jgi:hypothetical protein
MSKSTWDKQAQQTLFFRIPPISEEEARIAGVCEDHTSAAHFPNADPQGYYERNGIHPVDEEDFDLEIEIDEGEDYTIE